MSANKGFSIKELQERLGVVVDGKMGPQTQGAIRAIQMETGITADGIPGPQTEDMLRRLDPEEVARIIEKSMSAATEEQGESLEFQSKAGKSSSATPMYCELPDTFRRLMKDREIELIRDAKGPLPSSLQPTMATQYSMILNFGSDTLDRWLHQVLEGSDQTIRSQIATAAGTPAPLTIPLFVSASELFEGDDEFLAWCRSNKTFALRIIESPTDTNQLNGQLVYPPDKTKSLQGSEVFGMIGRSIIDSWPEVVFGNDVIEMVAEAQQSTGKQSTISSTIAPSEESAVQVTTATRSGFSADDLDRGDKLNLTAEVRALCAIVAARDVKPPLSIGLFGNWGTGKSFFIKEMMACINQMAASAQSVETARETMPDTIEPDYWSNIAQIKFNAWHYEDADLWANLVATIFDKLAAHVTTGVTDPDQARIYRQELFDEMKSLSDEIRETEEKLEVANQEYAAVELLRNDAVNAHEKAKADLQEINFGNIAETIKRQFLADQQQVKGYLENLGLADALESTEKLQVQMSRLRTESEQSRVQLGALKAKAKSSQGILVLLTVMVAALIVAALIRSIPLGTLPAWWADALTFVGPLVTGGIGLFSAIRRWLKPIDKTITQLASAAEDYEELQDMQLADHHDAVRAATSEVEEKGKTVERKRSELNKKSERRAALALDLKESRAGRRLHRFLEQRAASDEYRGKLGIIASIRQDFEHLSKMLFKQSTSKRRSWKKSENDQPTAEPGPESSRFHDVDRIVLYIDDLDRCKPERVVEVLHAVHLLLAFELFVVVVAVDSRWLLNSLQGSLGNLSFKGPGMSAYSNQTSPQSKQSLVENLVSTPQNYLEKIFQIPFTLAPMSKDGLESILKNLASPIEPETDQVFQKAENESEVPANSILETDTPKIETPAKPNAEEDEAVVQKNVPMEDKEKVVVPTTETDGSDLESEPDQNQKANQYADISPNLPQSNIHQYELEFMSHAYGGLSTPRAANRFVNTYRLIRSLLTDKEQTLFFEQKDGDYKKAITMLTILVGCPVEAELVINKLVQADPNMTWEKMLTNFPTGYGGLDSEKTGRLELVVNNFPGLKKASVGPYQEWARRVARYAFRPIGLPATKPRATKAGSA